MLTIAVAAVWLAVVVLVLLVGGIAKGTERMLTPTPKKPEPPKPVRRDPPPPPPTTVELMEKVKSIRDQNVAAIEASSLDERFKQRLIEKEDAIMEQRMNDLLE